jgi:hypothetical protein
LLGLAILGKTKGKIMRITDIIRDILDLVDGEQNKHPVVSRDDDSVDFDLDQDGQPDIEIEPEAPNSEHDDVRRFRQLAGIEAHNPDAEYSNEPHPTMTGIEGVTTAAGGGVNGPKHPADIRVKDPGAYQ